MEPLREQRAPVLSPSPSGGRGRSVDAAEPVLQAAGPSGRQVLATICRRELQILSEGFRFRAAMLLVLVLMSSSASISSVRFRAEERSYADAMAEYAGELEGATVAHLSTIRHPAIKPPWKLAFLVDGEQLRRPNVYRQTLSPWLEPELGRQRGDNYRLDAAEPLDWLFIVRVVLSLAAFVLGYDAFCGERPRAALKMMLSYPIARWQVAAAKFLAVWVCLAAPFIAGVPVSLLILRFYGGLRFTAEEWIKIASVLLLGLWAIAIFVWVALAISALSREAARSLASLALIWVTAVVVIPAASTLLVDAIQPLPTVLETDQRMAEIRRQVERGGPGSWRYPELAKEDDYAEERLAAKKQNERYARQERLRRNLAHRQLDQLQLERSLGSISPMLLIQDLAERLVGSGPYRNHSFLRQAWAFRDVLAAHVKALDLADPASPHLFFIWRYLSSKRIEAESVPRFDFREAAIGQGLGRSAMRLLWLGLTTMLLMAAVPLLFARYELE